MRNILITTAIAGMLSTLPAFAQTSDAASGTSVAVTAPEGYQSSDLGTLTFEELQGASVYDSKGDRVGEISDFVMSTTTDSSAGGANTSGTSTTTDSSASGTAATGSDTSTADTTTAGTDASGSNTTAAGTDAGGSDTTASGTDTSGSNTTAAGTDASGSGTTAAGTDATASGTTATDTGAAGSDTSATTNTETTTAAGTDTTAAPAMPGDRTGAISGRVTHVVMDIGGFLGIGEHTVAVPVSSLQLFRGSSATDLRVYLPWTEDQLKALPEYKEGDASTYGTDAGTNG